MLDPTMTYPCALFERPQVSLVDAQRAKLDRICQLLELTPDDELLEIGSGWGSFAIHAASRYGCRVTTTTISDAQFEVARKRVASVANSRHLVTVRPHHYRDLTGRYSKLASIEMFEAVDWRDHDDFFEACSRSARPARADGPANDRHRRGRLRSHEGAPRLHQTLHLPGGLPALGHIARELGRVTGASARSSCTTSGATIPRHCDAGGPRSTHNASR